VPKIDLELLAPQLERVITDLATLKDDAMVVVARLDRIDATVQSLVVEGRALHSRHERLARRSSASRSSPDPMRSVIGRRSVRINVD
jgi:hypothetical protein